MASLRRTVQATFPQAADYSQASEWAFDMTAISCKPSTSALIMHLHACGAIRRQGSAQVHNELLQLFESLGLPAWLPGLPAQLPQRWRSEVNSAPHADLLFAHKTGNTENYSADAGIVRGLVPAKRHELIALTSNLGSR